MVKSASGECHGSRNLWTGHGGLSLCAEVDLAWCFTTWSNVIESGGSSTGEVQSLTFQDEKC
jgi:hypothetical protein